MRDSSIKLWGTYPRDQAVEFIEELALRAGRTKRLTKHIPLALDLLVPDEEEVNVNIGLNTYAQMICAFISSHGDGGEQLIRDMAEHQGIFEHFRMVQSLIKVIADPDLAVQGFNEKVNRVSENAGGGIPYEVILYFMIEEFVDDYIPGRNLGYAAQRIMEVL